MCNNPEEPTFHLLRGGSLKSREILTPSFPLGMPRRRWMDNIKTDLRETGREGFNWMRVRHDRDKSRAVVNAVMNLDVPQNVGN